MINILKLKMRFRLNSTEFSTTDLLFFTINEFEDLWNSLNLYRLMVSFAKLILIIDIFNIVDKNIHKILTIIANVFKIYHYVDSYQLYF